jgi:hypothetical protein
MTFILDVYILRDSSKGANLCTGLPDFLSRRLEILDLRDSDLWAKLEKSKRRNLDLSLLNLIIIVLRD